MKTVLATREHAILAIEERDDRQLAAWMNSLRLDLQALGIERAAQDAPSLRAYLGGKADAA